MNKLPRSAPAKPRETSVNAPRNAAANRKKVIARSDRCQAKSVGFGRKLLSFSNNSRFHLLYLEKTEEKCEEKCEAKTEEKSEEKSVEKCEAKVEEAPAEDPAEAKVE